MTKRQFYNALGDADRWKSNEWVCMTWEKKCVSDSVSIVSLFIENEVAEYIFFEISYLLLQK